jgi:hypothetical protein
MKKASRNGRKSIQWAASQHLERKTPVSSSRKCVATREGIPLGKRYIAIASATTVVSNVNTQAAPARQNAIHGFIEVILGPQV